MEILQILVAMEKLSQNSYTFLKRKSIDIFMSMHLKFNSTQNLILQMIRTPSNEQFHKQQQYSQKYTELESDRF